MSMKYNGKAARYNNELSITSDRKELPPQPFKKYTTNNKQHCNEQFSFGSLMGSSFVSFKSRGSKASLMKSQDVDCNCQYKYYEYKSLHETMKNQLEIVKKELEVTKDLNDHFENQLQNYGHENQQEIQNVKAMIRQSKKQRDLLRDKYLKYKNYSNSLKIDFKNKMEAIYRKLKKQP